MCEKMSPERIKELRCGIDPPWLPSILGLRLIQCLDEIERAQSVISRCHEALGESDASDDETLPDGIALFVKEHKQRIEELETKVKDQHNNIMKLIDEK